MHVTFEHPADDNGRLAEAHLEEAVRRVGERVTDARDGANGVGARPQVCLLPQELV